MALLKNGPRDEGWFRGQVAQFFEATTDAIFFLDKEYRFTFLNRRACELLASGGDDILHSVLFERYPDTVYEGSPYVAAYTGSMERGEIGDFEAYYPAPFHFWLRVQSYPAEDGIMVFFRDVTQERALRESLRRTKEEAERQLAEIETVYRTAPIGLALFDAKEYRYLRHNDLQSGFFGLGPGALIGQGVTDMAPIEGLRELFDTVAGGQPVVNFPLEGYLATDPETLRYWTVNYSPVFAPDGTVTAITAASLEITHQKKSDRALMESEKLAVVGRLASSIAHEINNPLEAVTNLLYLAETSDHMDEARPLLTAAEVELRRVAAITSQTLRFHKQASSPQAVLAEDLIESVLSIFQGRFANSRITIVRRFRARHAIFCFEGEVRQVISNLVGNALDAMNGTEGTLHLRTRVTRYGANDREGIVLTVADTGGGMDAATLSRVFAPFFTTKGHTGTGLGLWISKEIVDRHLGTLHVRSSQGEAGSNERAAGRGTVFQLFLPLQ